MFVSDANVPRASYISHPSPANRSAVSPSAKMIHGLTTPSPPGLEVEGGGESVGEAPDVLRVLGVGQLRRGGGATAGAGRRKARVSPEGRVSCVRGV